MKCRWKFRYAWAVLLCSVLGLAGCAGLWQTDELGNPAETKISDRLYCITWYTQAYEDDTAILTDESEEMSIEMVFDDESLQEDVANMDVEFPLNTNERIADYALQLGEVLKAHGYLQPEMLLSEASYSVTGIWRLAYTPEAGNPLQAGSYRVSVSETDGHIIDIALWGE